MLLFRKIHKFNIFSRACFLLLALTFLSNLTLGYAADSSGYGLSFLPMPGKRLSLTAVFHPTVIKAVTFDRNNPLHFNFIIDNGDLRFSTQQLKDETEKLVKYFLTTLTIPTNDLWVNLSPYENSMIIPDKFGATQMGEEILAQDYLLKQLSSSLTCPETAPGRQFWQNVYAKVREKYGKANISINTFNKVWIVPAKAVIYEDGNTAFIQESSLKVMMEEDYLAMQKKGVSTAADKEEHKLSSQAMREIIVPLIESEVNQGKHFAVLRQIYNSIVLATWYKKKLSDSLLNRVYTDQSKLKGIEADDIKTKEKIYTRYVEAFKKGIYDYVHKDLVTPNIQVVRRYFSGGFSATNFSPVVEPAPNGFSGPSASSSDNGLSEAEVLLEANLVDEHRVARQGSFLAQLPAGKQADNVTVEIARLVTDLNNKGIKPHIRDVNLLRFMSSPDDLLAFIQRYSVIKNPEDIRRILLWKMHALGGKPLSGISRQGADMLYAAVFDQKEFLRLRSESSKPLKVVFFRRGQYGVLLTNILKTLPDVKVKVVLSNTDDGRSWFQAARLFDARGIPGAGKTLMDLSSNRPCVEFLEMRLVQGSLTTNGLVADFNGLIECMLNPDNASRIRLSDNMAVIFQKAMRMPTGVRRYFAKSLKSFYDVLSEYLRDHPGFEFQLHDIPLRSLALCGKGLEFKKSPDKSKSECWQMAIDDFKTHLGIQGGHEIIFPTKTGQHLVAVRADGTVHLAETSINEYRGDSPILGLWGFTDPLDAGFLNDLNRQGINVSTISKKEGDTGLEREIKLTTVKVDPLQVNQVVDIFSRHFASHRGEVTNTAREALSGADLILYSSERLTTNVGGALQVRGVKEAIIASGKNGNGSVKIALAEVKGDTPEKKDNMAHSSQKVLADLEKILSYINAIARHREDVDKPFDFSNAEQGIDYVLAGEVTGNYSEQNRRAFVDAVYKRTGSKIKPLLISAERAQRQGLYSPEALREAMIALVGINDAGFVVTPDGRLADKGFYAKPQQRSIANLGLFDRAYRMEHGRLKSAKTLETLIKEIKRDLPSIKARGAFVFDVDKTILPKGGNSVVYYSELAYLFMRLIREGVRVAIISGSSKEEQMARIVAAIRDELKDDISALEHLTFYVNGGSSKIGFDKDGKEVVDEKYNSEHIIPAESAAAITDAADPVVAEAALNGFYVEDAFFSALEKAYGLKTGVVTHSNWQDFCQLPAYSSAPDLKKILLEKFKAAAVKHYDEYNLDPLWESASAWKPQNFTPEELQAKKKAISEDKLSYPWIESRGKSETGDTLASLSVRAIPEFKIEVKRGGEKKELSVDSRGIIQGKIREKLGSDKAKEFSLRSGGSATTDITWVGSGKPAALYDFVVTKRLELRYVLYAGDEFYERDATGNKQLGNDEPIARDPRLKGVRTFAVNGDDMDGADESTLWIGRSPQATLEFLEQVLVRDDESGAGNSHDDGTDLSASASDAAPDHAGGVVFTEDQLNLTVKRVSNSNRNSVLAATMYVDGFTPVVLSLLPYKAGSCKRAAH